MLAASGGADGELPLLEDQRDARCSDDFCLADLHGGGRRWRIAATRSSYPLDRPDLMTQCAAADIVVSDRRLPTSCRPRWLKLDPAMLARTGGVAISLAGRRVETVRVAGDQHPWATATKLKTSKRGHRYGRGRRRRGEPASPPARDDHPQTLPPPAPRSAPPPPPGP